MTTTPADGNRGRDHEAVSTLPLILDPDAMLAMFTGKGDFGRPGEPEYVVDTYSFDLEIEPAGDH